MPTVYDNAKALLAALLTDNGPKGRIRPSQINTAVTDLTDAAITVLEAEIALKATPAEVDTAVAAGIAALKAGASGAADTLIELENLINAGDSAAAALVTTVSNLLADPRGETTVASATTCDIGAAQTAKVSISGTSSITSFGTVANRLRFIRFEGILALVYHATSMILPSGVSITTAAGDTAIALSDASGNWRVYSYTRADGTPLVSAGSVPVGSSILWNQSTPPSGYLEEDGSSVSRAAYPNLFAVLVKTATVTMTIASPCVVSWAGHTLKANDPVKIATTGAIPTGLTAGTTYYVKSPGAGTFNLSATPGGAAINTTGSQSGVHTGINAPFGDGDGSTTFNLPESRGEFVRGWANARAVDTNRSFGSAQTEMIGPHAHPVPSYSGGAVGSSGRPEEGTTGSADTFDTSNNTGTENRPRNIAKMWCIKY